MKHLNGFYVPNRILATGEILRSGIPLRVPQVDPPLVQEVSRMLKARHRGLAGRPLESIVEQIDRVSARWLDPHYPLRRRAGKSLPPLTGFSIETVEGALNNLFRSLRKPSLQRLLSEEFSNPFVLDGFSPTKNGALTRAFGPCLTLLILSGNIVGAAVEALVFSLLIKSPCLLKPAQDEPILSVLWLESLAEIDPNLASCLAVLPWRGGEVSVEETAFAEAESVVAYGNAAAISDLSARLPPNLPFSAFGPRFSVGLIARERIDTPTAARAARDVTRFEMRGCLSPQIFYVEKGGKYAPETFGALLSEQMKRLQPEGLLPSEDAVLAQQLRSVYLMRGATLWSQAGHTVIFDPSEEPVLSSSPERWVLVRGVEDLLSLPERLHPLRGALQAVGLAVDAKRRPPLVERLSLLGISRICPIGNLQEPPLTWHQDGRLRLADRVRWVDLEG